MSSQVIMSPLQTRMSLSKVLLSTGDTLLQALDFLPLLMQTVEKAASQGTQVPTVTEGVAAALLLSKLSVADAQAGKGLWVCGDLGGEAVFIVPAPSASGLTAVCRNELRSAATGTPPAAPPPPHPCPPTTSVPGCDSSAPGCGLVCSIARLRVRTLGLVSLLFVSGFLFMCVRVLPA